MSDGNVVRVVNFATSKNLIFKSTVFPHHNIYALGLLMGKHTTRLVMS